VRACARAHTLRETRVLTISMPSPCQAADKDKGPDKSEQRQGQHGVAKCEHALQTSAGTYMAKSKGEWL
jgi:hypothetical protein